MVISRNDCEIIAKGIVNQLKLCYNQLSHWCRFVLFSFFLNIHENIWFDFWRKIFKKNCNLRQQYPIFNENGLVNEMLQQLQQLLHLPLLSIIVIIITVMKFIPYRYKPFISLHRPHHTQQWIFHWSIHQVIRFRFKFDWLSIRTD